MLINAFKKIECINLVSNQKWEIFRKVKELKELCGDVRKYVAQLIPQIDTEIAEKGHFWMEPNSLNQLTKYVNANKLTGVLNPSLLGIL